MIDPTKYHYENHRTLLASLADEALALLDRMEPLNKAEKLAHERTLASLNRLRTYADQIAAAPKADFHMLALSFKLGHHPRSAEARREHLLHPMLFIGRVQERSIPRWVEAWARDALQAMDEEFRTHHTQKATT